jgi:hypothetical protein
VIEGDVKFVLYDILLLYSLYMYNTGARVASLEFNTQHSCKFLINREA